MSIDFQPQITNKLAYAARQNNPHHPHANNSSSSTAAAAVGSYNNNTINNSSDYLNSRHYQIHSQIMPSQDLITPPASTLKLFSKKLLMTSDLANRFLVHVTETEKAQQRIKQREKSAAPGRDNEASKKMFTIIGSEIVGVKKHVLANREEASQHKLVPSPAVSTLSLTQPLTSTGLVTNELLVASNSPILSPKREKSAANLVVAAPGTPLELISAYNCSTDPSYLPQIHTAAFFPRRHPIHSSKGRPGALTGVSTLKIASKPCAFCPNNHALTVEPQTVYTSSCSVTCSPSPPPAPRSAVAHPKTPIRTSAEYHQPPPMQQQQQAQTPLPVEHSKTLPNIILNFNTSMQPQVVPPPLMPNRKKPWNWPRSFNPTTSPNQSRLSTAIAIRSISTAEMNHLRYGGIINYTSNNNNKPYHTSAHPLSRSGGGGGHPANALDEDIAVEPNSAILNKQNDVITADNNGESTGEAGSEQPTAAEESDVEDRHHDETGTEKLHVTFVKIAK